MANREFLREASDDPALASHLTRGCRNAGLDAETRAVPDSATKPTREPAAMRRTDVERLREQGLTDEQALSVTLIACLFNFMTRLADVRFAWAGAEGERGIGEVLARRQCRAHPTEVGTELLIGICVCSGAAFSKPIGIALLVSLFARFA